MVILHRFPPIGSPDNPARFTFWTGRVNIGKAKLLNHDLGGRIRDHSHPAKHQDSAIQTNVAGQEVDQILCGTIIFLETCQLNAVRARNMGSFPARQDLSVEIEIVQCSDLNHVVEVAGLPKGMRIIH